MEVLFICNGNVARSQEAEVFFNAMKRNEDDIATSAGVEVILGKPINPDVIQVMKENGYDMPGAVRKDVTEQMVADADIIVSFKPANELPEYISSREDVKYWDIKDPRGQSIEFHRDIRDQVKAKVTELVDEINE